MHMTHAVLESGRDRSERVLTAEGLALVEASGLAEDAFRVDETVTEARRRLDFAEDA